MKPEKARSMRRREAAIYRESVALRMYAEGIQSKDIAKEIDVAPGSVAQIVRRGLERRAADDLDPARVPAARALYVARLEALVTALLPAALGRVQNPDSDEDVPALPNVRAADLVARLAEKVFLAVGGAAQIPTNTTNELHLHLGDRAEQLRNQILASLAATSQHDATVRTQLALTVTPEEVPRDHDPEG